MELVYFPLQRGEGESTILLSEYLIYVTILACKQQLAVTSYDQQLTRNRPISRYHRHYGSKVNRNKKNLNKTSLHL